MDARKRSNRNRAMKQTAEDIATEIGPRQEWEGRAVHGLWQEPGLAVHQMVKKGWGISEAIRELVRKMEVPSHYQHRAFTGIRGAYYQILNKSR